MREPLFWNPLPECANWLSERTGQQMDARTVVDMVAKMGTQGEPSPTIIATPIPPKRGVVRVMMPGHPQWDTPRTQVQQAKIRMLEQRFGAIHDSHFFKYCEEIYPIFSFLYVSDLMRLLIYGHSELAVIQEPRKHAHELAILMPWDGEHPITIDDCGMKKDELVALGELLASSYSPASTQSSPTEATTTTSAPSESASAVMPTCDKLCAEPVQVAPGLPKRERQIKAIEAAAAAQGYNALSIPTGGKTILMNECRKSYPELFGAGPDPFRDAWKKAVSSSPPRLRMADHEKFSK